MNIRSCLCWQKDGNPEWQFYKFSCKGNSSSWAPLFACMEQLLWWRTSTKTFLVPFSCIPESLHFFRLRGELVHYGKQEETLGQLLLRRETCRSLDFKSGASCLDIFTVCANWLLSKCKGKLMGYFMLVRAEIKKSLLKQKADIFPMFKGMLVFTENI